MCEPTFHLLFVVCCEEVYAVVCHQDDGVVVLLLVHRVLVCVVVSKKGNRTCEINDEWRLCLINKGGHKSLKYEKVK